jgi:uncharacterized RDD family membrane protein YckC
MLVTCAGCGQQQMPAKHCVSCGQPLMDANPYASPMAISPGQSPFLPPTGMPMLAGRLERFVAQIVDGLLNLAAALPGIVLLIVSAINAGPDEDPGPLFFVGLIIAGVGSLALNIYQWVLISQSGQSIGKRLMRVRIVKLETQQPPGFVYGVLLRLWVNGLLSGLPCGIGLVYTLVDLLFIFREDRRCVHDHLAQTVVIQA